MAGINTAGQECQVATWGSFVDIRLPSDLEAPDDGDDQQTECEGEKGYSSGRGATLRGLLCGSASLRRRRVEDSGAVSFC
jgi:hypothetical protein